MRRGGGKNKGGAFERFIAKAIVKAYRKPFGIEQRECWRSVLSGGHFMSAGDLALSDRLAKLFPWATECKFRKKVKWENILAGKKGTEEMNWIDQAKQGADKRKGLKPLLVIKANHQPIRAFVCDGVAVGGDNPCWIDGQGDCWTLMPWTRFLNQAVKEAQRKAE